MSVALARNLLRDFEKRLVLRALGTVSGFAAFVSVRI
jgi:hypothetical protein